MFPEPDLIFEHLYPLRKRRVKLGDGGEVISPSYQLIKVEDSIHKIISILNEGGHKALIIGGAVRDALLGVAPKDIDIEVYKISYEELERVLSEYGKVDLVGQTFGVILFQPDGSDMTYDFSIPRKENKVGVGHKGFKVFFDKDMTIKEASTRRDFTFNALAYDPLENKIYDYFGGVKDLEDKVIRHTSDAFKEDALRVLRALQFQSRFDFSIHPDTLVEMRKMVASEDFDDLPRERLFGEFNKWAIKGVRHDLIFQFMRDTGLIEKYPELKSLAETPQDYIYHPEGNVEIHTTMTLVEMDKIIARENIVGEEKLLLVMSILLHDIGKPATTKEEFKRGRLTITSNGHEALGGTMSRDILAKMGFHEELITPVDNIVSNHLAGVSISMIPRKSGKLKAVKKLSRRLYPATIKQLMYVVEADNRGRGGEQKEPAGMSDLAELSIEADILNKPYESILKGRDLIAIGLKPSPKFGEIIRASFEAQESGEFSDLEGAKKWLLDNVNKFNAGGGVNDAEFSRMDNPAGKIFTDGDNFYKINNFVFDKMYYSEVVPPLFFSKGLIDTIEISRGELMSKFKDGKYRWVHAGGGKTGDEIESEKLYNRKNNVDESRGIEYHGTSKKNMESIRRNGFKKEFNVNITTDIDEAKEYASYYGNPAVLKVRLKKGAKPIAERGLDANAFHADDVVLDYSEVSNKNYGKHDEGMSLLYGDKMEKGGAVSEKSDSKQPSAPAPVIDADVGGRGGLVVGDSHAESPIGGVPFILEDSGTKILEEGEEANIPVEVREIKKEYTLKGKNHEIVHRILQMVGLKLSDKVSSVKSGDLVISKASLWDDKVRTYKGTPIQILSAVNESKGGNHIESGAVMIEDGKSVKMESGGAVGYDKEIKILSGGKNKKSGELIGIGSAREIYDIGKGKVKKVSYNKKGIEQNRNEVFINENSDSDIIPKLFDYDKKYKWIVVEKADYATENKMDDYFKGTGFSFWDIEYYIWSKQEQGSKKYKVISSHPFVKALVELKNKFGLDSNDLSSYKNYGFIKGKLKLIDYGMTDKTKKDFYSKNDGKEISEEDAVEVLYGKSDSSVMADGGEVNAAIDKMIAFGMAENNQSIVRAAKFIGDFDLEKDTLIKAKYEDLKYWVKKAIPSKNYEGLSDWREKLRSNDPKDFVNILYWESHGDVVGRIPKYTANLEKQFNKANVSDPEVSAWVRGYIKRLKEFIPVAEKFEAMKLRIGKKEISKEAKESQARQDAYAKIYAFMPSVNKEILSKLVGDITKSFKPFEDAIYELMDERYRKLIQSYVEREDEIRANAVSRDIIFYDGIFDIKKQYDKNEKVIKRTRGGYEHETWERHAYLRGFSKKDGWENVLDSKIRSIIEDFRVELLFTIMEKFEKITLPIKKYKLLSIDTGRKGFEGSFEFKFDNGSSFIFETQAIVAGGYNIQIEHLRYISHFKNAILSNGKKLSDPHLTKIVENFSIQEPEKDKEIEEERLAKSRYVIGDLEGKHTVIDIVPYVNKLGQKDENRFFVSAQFKQSVLDRMTYRAKTSDHPMSSYDEYISDMVNRGGAKKMEKGGDVSGDSFVVKFSRATMMGSVDNLYNGIEQKLSSRKIKFHSDKNKISFDYSTDTFFWSDSVKYVVNKYADTPIYATQLRPELEIDYEIISGEPSKKDIVEAFENLFERIEDKKEIEYEEDREDYDPSVEYWIAEKNKFSGGGEVSRIKESIEYLNRAPHARMDLYFDDESRRYPQKGKPNSLVTSASRGTLTGKKKWEAHDIVAYDNKGKIVGVLSILTKSEADEESVGAFKIVVRDDARMKGWATKLLNRAEEDGIDMIEAVRHNNYSSRGRWMIRLWLEKKLESGNKMGDGEKTKSESAKWNGISNPRALTNSDLSKDMKFSNGGKILLAPNGEPSSLTSEQYQIVRTHEFKKFFGDWNKKESIKRFYDSKRISIPSALPYKKEDDHELYRQNIFNYIEANRLNNYTNRDSGIKMRFGKSALKKIRNHSAAIESIEILNYIREIIEESAYVTFGENINLEEGQAIPYYHYLFSEIEFKGSNYIVYTDVKETRNKHDKYVIYDFTLFKTERSELVSRIQLSKHGRLATPDPLYYKGKKLSLIFDTSDKNISKVIDENGEPLICYHGTNKKFSVFDEKMKGSNTPDNNTKYGFFFSKFKDEARVYMRDAVWKDTPELYDHLYGGHILEVFLNIKNPAQLPYAGSLNTGKVEMALREGMDGIIDERGDYVTFYPEQIKLADGSNKIFDGHNPDIRYGTGGEVDESNYFQNTKGEFEIINKEEYDSVDAEEFVSEFGSRYKVKDGMLYRGADHWGVFGTVIWSLKNKEYIGDSFEGELDTGLDGYDKPIYAKIPFRSLSFNNGIVVDKGGLVKVWVSMTTNSARAGVTPFIEVHPSLSIDDVRNVVAGKYPDYAYFKYRGTRHTQ